MTAVLEADGIVAGYGESEILHGVSLRVESGETVSVLGPNGSGKSTLVKSIVGLVRVRDGHVRLDGRDITNLPPEQIVQFGLGYVPQTDNVFPSLTVFENLEVGAHKLQRHAISDALQRVFSVFPVLRDRQHSRAGLLSGGERQMLAMARVLMVNPRVLVLDEPSAALSPLLRNVLFQKIAEVGSMGTAILLVEQNARLSLGLSARGYIMAMGRNELDGDADKLLDNEEVGRLYLGR